MAVAPCRIAAAGRGRLGGRTPDRSLNCWIGWRNKLFRSSCDRPSARRAILACPACANCPSCQFVADSSLATSGKSHPHSRTSWLAEEGRFAIVTSVEPAMRRACCSAAGCHSPRRRTGGCDGEMVWSWHPGADAKSAVMMSRRRRGQDSRSPGRAPITRQTVAQGRPDIGLYLWFCRVLSCCTRTAGISRYPVFPAPSLQESRAELIQSSGATRREIATLCLPCCLTG